MPVERNRFESHGTVDSGDTDKDDALLATLGYKPEFKRNFTQLQVFGIGFSIIGLLPSFSSVLIYSIPNGGCLAMVWGWTVCAFFLTAVGLAMADIASAAPTSGGLYYWTFMFSSPKWRCFLSWIVGYANTVSNVASVASVDYGLAVQIMAAASIGSNMSFQATVPQTFALYCGLLLCHGAICSLDPKIIARLQTPYIVINIVLVLAIIIGLPAATPKSEMNTAKFAFSHFLNVYGWPDGYAFILSFLTPCWTLGCFDAPLHMSEEAKNASIAIPRAILFSTVVSLIFGWGINVALTFCMGTDLRGILASPIGQPMATILFNSFGRNGTLVLWVFVVIVQFAMGTGMLTTCSRQIFAFSRDGALPFSRWVYDANRRTAAPVHAVWFAVFLSILLGSLVLAGPDATAAVFSLVVTGQYVAYSIPITARFLGKKELKRGPFTLGAFSPVVAAVAVTWMVFMTLVFLFPTAPNPIAGNMNYTVVVLGGTLVLATLYYFFPKYGGVHFFTGPVSTLKDRTAGTENIEDSDLKKDSDVDIVEKMSDAADSLT